MATMQDYRNVGAQNWSNFQAQASKTSQADWDKQLQYIQQTYGNDPQAQAKAIASAYLANTNATQYLNPQVRDWIVSQAPRYYMMNTIDTLTGSAPVDASKLQGGMDWGQFTNFLNNAQAGTYGYTPGQANAKWATFQQRMADARNPNSTMDAGVRGIWQNMDEQDLLDYQRLLMGYTLSPMLRQAADRYIQDQWVGNSLLPPDQRARYDQWVTRASGNPMFNSRWRW